MPNIVVVNPRAMHFGESRATSIDLCVRDMVHYSRFKATTTVIGDAVESAVCRHSVSASAGDAAGYVRAA